MHATRGPARPTIDRTAEKNHLLALAREQTAQIERARQLLLGAGRRRLSELGPLNELAFRLFLELLGHALAQRSTSDAIVEIASADGTIGKRAQVVWLATIGRKLALAASKAVFQPLCATSTMTPILFISATAA